MTLDLVDGSRIALHSSSQVMLELTAAHRDVRLERGGVLFSVSKGVAPFDVYVDHNAVKALGTVFSVVNKGHDSLEAVVHEGRVLVVTKEHGSLLVNAGEVAEVSSGVASLRPPAASRLGQRLTWTAGVLEFNGQNLSEAVNEINRYNLRKIAVDPEIADQTIAGRFPVDDPAGFAEALHGVFGFEYTMERRGGVEIIHVRGKMSHRNMTGSSGDRDGLAVRP
jgi:transmembrane sensor